MGNERCPVCSGTLEMLSPGLQECAWCGLAVCSVATCSAGGDHPGAGWTDDLELSKKRIFCLALDLLAGLVPGKGRLLDVGCAGGGLMKTAASQGWRPEGVETDAALSAVASRSGFRVFTGPVEKAGLVSGAYDAAAVMEVFSQMADPAAAAAELFRVLKPGGALVAREFNAAFHLAASRPPLASAAGLLGLRPAVLHPLNFRVKTLRALLEGAGFRDVRVTTSPPTGGDPYRTGGRFWTLLVPAAKHLYYAFSRALEAATLGRAMAGASVLVTARKQERG